MKGRLAIFLTLVLLVVVLVALNAASYVRVEEEPDTEVRPDRSTLNAGATGTRALYEFLQQSGYDVARWTETPSALLNDDEGRPRPATFVIAGDLRVPFRKEEARSLLRWVAAGGRLVVIDRAPDPQLLPSAGGWLIRPEIFELPGEDVRPDDAEKMTAGVRQVSPAQPTILTRDVETVLASRYAARLRTVAGQASKGRRVSSQGDIEEAADTLPDEGTPQPTGGSPAAPVRHVPDARGGEGALLVDYAYGHGRIVVLADPYVVSNGGISRADNLQLAVNVVAGAGGLVAFDEYHQARGAMHAGALRFFAGTPVLWMFVQAALVGLAVLWSRSRRFARALPAPHEDRRSKLEFVASMAELQQRARAYGLAVENVYARTRRALARYAGLAASAPYEEIAARVAARAGKDAREVEATLRECEAATAGDEQLDARRGLALVRQLRELERDLGIRMRAREIRQREQGKR